MNDWMRTRLSFLAAGMAGALLCAVPGQAGVYKWRDATGKLRFSDKPPHEGAVADAPSGPSTISVIKQEIPDAFGFRKSYQASRNGHHVIDVKVNGKPVTFMADTGASVVTLNRETARQVGIADADLVFSQQATTANGTIRMAPVTVEMAIDSLRLHGVEAAVNQADMKDNLLGMSFFSRLKRFHSEGAVLTIEWDASQTR